MLFLNGKEVQPQVYKNEYQRVKFLAGCRETLGFLKPKLGRMFKLSERAKFKV